MDGDETEEVRGLELLIGADDNGARSGGAVVGNHRDRVAIVVMMMMMMTMMITDDDRDRGSRRSSGDRDRVDRSSPIGSSVELSWALIEE